MNSSNSLVTNIASNASTVATNATNAATNMATNIVSNIKTNISNIANGTNSKASTGLFGVVFFYGLIIVVLGMIAYYFEYIRQYGSEYFYKIKNYLMDLFGKGDYLVPEEAKKILKPSERPGGMPGASDPSTLEKIGEHLSQRSEVFNVSRNIYTYNDASAVCRSLGADLATYEQVKEAYDHGADWCNYGWVKGQMAVYPTQRETWDKLQKGPDSSKGACGQVGINGGYFDNPELRFGVNCFGAKPSKRETDAISNELQLPKSSEEVEFDKKVQRFRDQLDQVNILPFNRGLTEGSWGSN